MFFRILIFKMEKTYQQTDQASSQAFLCDVCSKSFTKRRSLTKHQKLHTGEHCCRYCCKPFSDRFSVKRHEMIHTQHRNITSDTQTENLTENKKINKPAEEILRENAKFLLKPYLCIHCFTPFEKRSVLNDHKMIDHGIADSTSLVNFTSEDCMGQRHK